MADRRERTDAERLDWIQANGRDDYPWYVCGTNSGISTWLGQKRDYGFLDLREAIDAAMDAEESSDE